MVGRDKMGIAQFRGLFRGKRVDNDEWVEGYLIQSTEFCGKSDPHTFIVNHEHPQSCFGSDIYIEVIPETLSQYTGIKDENDVRVFEGDILRISKESDVLGNYYYPEMPYRYNVIVKWGFCAWTWETITQGKRYILFPDAWCHSSCTYEVIGNIYDNPELLEEGSE